MEKFQGPGSSSGTNSKAKSLGSSSGTYLHVLWAQMFLWNFTMKLRYK